ncbi:MAG: glutamate--tRNA ligase family protein, partial [Eggerthellaceae bacterium]|nr:glutamate--tRNA ligase family protein [Eggerthellaceae bacterium]
VVCDDVNMQISHVIRGDDHLSNTPRQILIYEALGLEPPVFAHLSMILGPDGKKLSKRHGAASVEEYCEAGYLCDALVNYLALLGWSLDGETTVIDRSTLAASFSLSRVTKKDAIFVQEKLDWLNGVYIRELDAAAWVGLARPWLIAAGADAADIQARPSWYESLFPLVAQRMQRLDEAAEKLAYMFWGSEVKLDAPSVASILHKDEARARKALEICRGVIASLSIPWNCEALQIACRSLGEEQGFKAKELFQPLRVAVCGNMVSPPLFESIELLARGLVLSRIDQTMKLVFEDRFFDE